MLSRIITARGTRVAVAAALVATVFAFSAGSPTSAAPQTKTLTGSCSGADAASAGLLAAFGGTLNMPFQITSDVPAQLDPEADDQPISFTWSVTLAASVTSQVAAIDPSLTIKDITLDMGVTGPTETKVVEGRPAPLNVNVTAGQPATFAMGPFAGQLTGIGKGGVIKYSPKAIGLTISIDIGGKATDVKVNCAAAGTAAITSIKIPGSPDIKQPIELEGTANSSVTVDVLGEYVTPGKDENGKEMPVKPETLKVVDGPGQVTDGKVVVNTGAAGTTSSVTFEVCSGELPGTDEVQTLTLDTTGETLKKGVAFTLKYGEEVTAPINMIDENSLPVILNPGLLNIPTNDWMNNANNYFLVGFQLPAPGDIQSALERLPSIGGGGVVVTAVQGKPGTYDIKFVGKNGQKDVDSLAIDHYYSVFPQEALAGIIDAAKGLLGGGGGEGPTTTTTLPGGAADLDGAIAWLTAQINAEPIFSPRWQELFGQRASLEMKKAMANIDVNAAIAMLTGLFSTPPNAVTTTAGEAPIGICSQGIIDVAVPAAAPTAVAGASTPGADVAGANQTGASLALAG